METEKTALRWLPLRDAVTFLVHDVLTGVAQSLQQLPNRYADARTIHRERALELVENGKRALEQRLDTALLNAAQRIERRHAQEVADLRAEIARLKATVETLTEDAEPLAQGLDDLKAGRIVPLGEVGRLTPRRED